MAKYNNNFYSDLQKGKEAEELFAEVAKTKFGATNICFNTSNKKEVLREWDIKYTNKKGVEITFEIKNDLLSTDTGNFAVEFWGTNKASGINVTKANFWVIQSGLKFYIFRTASLKQFIKENNFKSIQITNGSAYCYLIPINKAIEIVYQIENIT